jgi:hypothetical protein
MDWASAREFFGDERRLGKKIPLLQELDTKSNQKGNQEQPTPYTAKNKNCFGGQETEFATWKTTTGARHTGSIFAAGNLTEDKLYF